MSIKIIYPSEFKEMPWKNGGGSTTELFRIANGEEFKFRISKAELKDNGSFSIYPHVDRILLLDKGNGFSLKSPNIEVTLNDPKTMFHFRGEEIVECSLINGPCTDLNIMTDRRYAQTKISTCEMEPNESLNLTSTNALTIIYDRDENKIYQLELNDSCTFNATSSKNLLVIGVDFNE